MGIITRRLPQSNLARQKALNQAKEKQSTVPPGSEVLRATTVTTLSSQTPVYNNALQDVAVAQSNLSGNTADKDPKMEDSRMFTSQFIQVFNFGVRRKKYPANHRAHYQLAVDSEAVPNLDAEADVLLWGQRIVDGDVTRLAAGGAPMTNPDAAEVDAKQDAALAAFNLQSTLADALDAKQELVDDLNVDADTLIKRVWDEVESFYNDEAPDSKRANAREWGVVYITEGVTNTVTGLVKNTGGVPQPGADVVIVQSGADTVTNPEGRYSQPTNLTGTITIRVTLGTLKGETTVVIPENAEGQTINVGDIVVA